MLHITITQNDETLVDLDTKVIIGAFDKDEETTAQMVFIERASTVEIEAVIDSAEKAIKSCLRLSPKIALLHAARGLDLDPDDKEGD